MLCVKALLRQRGLNTTVEGGIGSYLLFAMAPSLFLWRGSGAGP